MKELTIYESVKEIYNLKDKNIFDLTFTEFKSIIKFNSYNAMTLVLGDTRYPKKHDYGFMTTDQAKTIQLIEDTSEFKDQIVSQINQLGRENLKTYIIQKYPDKLYLIDFCDLDWNNLNMIYDVYHNRVKEHDMTA